jgi:hypothetical protein
MVKLMRFFHQLTQEFTILVIMNTFQMKACFTIILKSLSFMAQAITYHLGNKCGGVDIGTQLIPTTRLLAESL